MKTTVGLWIDHQKALLVFLDGKEVETRVIKSQDETHHRQSGVSQPADDIRHRELTGHLNRYYDEVVSCIHEAEAILIFGPGEAKGELKKRLEKNHLDGHIVGVETADKMTEPQVVAKVREHFLHGSAAAGS